MTDNVLDRSARRRELFFLLCCVVLTGFLRFLAVRLRGNYLGFDESMYIVLGRNLLTGKGYVLNGLPSATFPFGISLIAGAADIITGSARWALSGATVLFGALTVIPLYLLVRDAWNRPAAAVAVIFFSGMPALLSLVPFRKYADIPYAGSEAIFVFFILAAACVFYRAAKTPSVALGLAGGYFAGIAFEVRQDATAYFLLFVALVYVAGVFRERKLLPRRALAAAVSAGIVFAILVAPFFLWVKHVTGRFYSGPRFAQTYRMRPQLDIMVAHGNWGPALLSYFGLNGDQSMLESPYYGVAPYHKQKITAGSDSIALTKTLRSLRPGLLIPAWSALWRQMLPPGAWIFAAVGLVSAVSKRRWLLLGFVASLVLPSVWVTMILYVLGRFYVVAVLAALLLAARGFELCLRRIAAPLVKRRLVRPAAFVFLGIPLVLSLYLASHTLAEERSLRADYSNYERAFESKMDALAPVIDELVPKGASIITATPWIDARLGRTWLARPVARPSDIAEYARKRSADFLLVANSDGYFMRYAPEDIIRELPGATIVFDDKFAGERFVLLDLSVNGKAVSTYVPKGRFQKFVLITVDTLRKDHLGCYGYGLPTSPAIDDFASSAIVFENAFSPCPFTCPSVTGIHTSRFPGLVRSGFANGFPVDPVSAATLAKVFRKNLYHTAAFVGNFTLRSACGLADGFDVYNAVFDSAEINRGKPERVASSLTAPAITWLRSQSDNPFFLWIHYQDPHGPYTPPPPYDTLFTKDLPAAVSLPVCDNVSGLGGIPDYQVLGDHRDFHYYRAQHDGEIAFADSFVSNVLDALAELSIADDTVVIVSADHGEAFGEHNYYFAHGQWVGPELTAAPLIVKIPGTLPARCAAPVSTIDIAPTITSLAGFKRPGSFLGENLVSTFKTGRREGHFFTENAFSIAAFEGPYCFQWGAPRAMTGRPENIKAVDPESIDFANAPMALYDIVKDPLCTTDISASEPKWAQYLRGLSVEHITLSSAFNRKSNNLPLDEETRRALEALGYLNR